MFRADAFRRKVRLPPGSGLEIGGGDDVDGSALAARLSGDCRRDTEDSMEDPTGPGIREFWVPTERRLRCLEATFAA
jgi:hypothetical protein